MDPTLQTRCDDEMPQFLLKCVACYLDLIQKHRHQGIWDKGVLPEFFHKSRRSLQCETNPILSFLTDTDLVVVDAGASCTYACFKAAYADFCRSNSITKHTLDASRLRSALWTVNGVLHRAHPDADVSINPHARESHLTGVGLV